MNIGELAALITSLATLLGVLWTIHLSRTNAREIEKVHVATNGMKDQLVAATAASSNAAGNREGRAELKAEQSDGA